MPQVLKPLLRLSIPLLLLILAVLSLGKTDLIDSGQLQLLGLLPYGVFALVLGLAHYFNRSRFFSAALLMSVSFWFIQTYLQNSLIDSTNFHLFLAMSLLLPLALLFLIILPERGLWNIHGLMPLSITPLFCGLCYMLFINFNELEFKAVEAFFSLKPYAGYILSINASLWFLFLLAVALTLLFWRDTEVEASLFANILFVFLTFAFFDRPLISTIMFSMAGIALAAGLLRSSFEMAYRDDLTGLLGRRAFNEKLMGLSRNYVIAMMDVDHFKKFNDTHGHDVGDDVLKVVASQIAQISGGGTPYRYGGEEFVIVFPRKTLKACIPHLEAVREAIADYAIILRNKNTRPKTSKEGASNRGKRPRQKSVSVTISIGLAEKNATLIKPEFVLKAADKALYKAKQSGRNCLCH